MTARLAVIGAGMMGEALARGLLGAGWSSEDIVLADVRSERLDELAGSMGVSVATDNRDAARRAGSVLLAVKPQDAGAALRSMSGEAGSVVSIVAGLRTEAVEDGLGGEPSVIRAMPNTPARIGRGATALAPGRFATEDTRALAGEIFGTVGTSVWLDEELLDAVTALSGSGPAYVFYLAEILVDAAVELGLPRQVAETLTFATIEGAGGMLLASDAGPRELRAQVTSKGGTTAAAVELLESKGARQVWTEAVEAAYRRSRELGAS